MQEFKKKDIYNEYLIRIEKEKKRYDHPGPQITLLPFFECDLVGPARRQSCYCG